MDKYDRPVADRYHELDDEVRTLLDNLHNQAIPYFQDFEYFGQAPIRGMLRTDVAALNRTPGITNLLQSEPADIHWLFELDREYRRTTDTSESEIVLGMDSHYNPDTSTEYFDFHATKIYPHESRVKKLGGRAAQMAIRAQNFYETTAQPKLKRLQKKLGSFASRIARPILQR